MALKKYKCRICGRTQFAFENERRLPVFGCSEPTEKHRYDVAPPDPTIVHCTESFMSTETRLDSLASTYELDRQLNIEAQESREMKVFQQARRNS